MNYETEIKSDLGDASDVKFAEQGGFARFTTGKARWVIAAILILAAIIGGYMLMSGGETAADDNRDAQAPSISVIAPGRTTVTGEITATGTLAARREMPVGVVGEGGRVISVPVEQGSWVRQGQVLAVIDRSVQTQQAQSAAAQIQVAQADANLAQANLDRALQLVERGFVSKADVDRLTATRDAAAARVRVAQASLRELQARNARLNIVAPSAGLVLERNVEPGQTVSGGSPPLFLIAKGGEMEMLARLSEADLARLSPGESAEVTPSGSDKSFSGQIWQLAPTIDAQDRQGTARIALPYAPELRPGGFATATISSGTLVAPILPESAVLSDREGDYVFVIDGENKAVRRSVTTGEVTSRGIVISEGLTGSEKVVLRAGGFLTEGETVVPDLVKLGGE
ncbi:efflux RND transporter periplasmic adaptor subunit [Qipengyuania nanhaisediminis]|uniref:RND family efflux transporter, MFP subunit n=1 Tax=Qipengyuania nanhaisediminis TaxID=604088 RepID=A0A1I5KYD9_9SPHN|nr:efflux RND transporter periplasmic adaptor subunit [Qipengyuania nanhaisediminis]SFO90120.1 RND family efflux transporter, MFP subunit [Qipengyuania nanhaisediminis]